MVFNNYDTDTFCSNFENVISQWSFDEVIDAYKSLCFIVDSPTFSSFPFSDEVFYGLDTLTRYVLGLFDDDDVLNAFLDVLKSKGINYMSEKI